MNEKTIKELAKTIEATKSYRDHNGLLFDVYEGELLPEIKRRLKGQVSENAFEQVCNRIAPINILNRIVRKLSRIYQEEPSRYVEDGVAKDEDLLKWYEEGIDVNTVLNLGNEFFNLMKGCLLEPFISNGKPYLRAIPFDRFFVYSDDETFPNRPTAIGVFMGFRQNSFTNSQEIWHVWTDDEFLIIDQKGQVLADEMAASGNPDGINPYRKIPFVYVNRSQSLLMPKLDTDTLELTTLIPILLADINYSVMYQAFSIIYTIDVDSEDVKLNPNAIWELKSDGDGELKPEIGSIKPQVDISEVLGLIQAELAFWLNSRGIRAGSVGSVSTENMSSGISKIIDEMDAAEDRKEQVGFFTKAEKELWDLIFRHMHPVWVQYGMVENRALLSPNAKIMTNFSEQLPLLNRGDFVEDLEAEMRAGFISRRRAIKKLNPRMSESEIDELIAEIDSEREFLEIEDEQSEEEVNAEDTPAPADDKGAE